MFDKVQMTALTEELNHLLWTEDPPDVPEDVAEAAAQNQNLTLLKTNMQCVAHTVVCAALFLRRGEKVMTRGGSALIVYPEQEKLDEPHWVIKHWWITTGGGLCDLSLNLTGLSRHKPIIFNNQNIAEESWRVSFTHDFARAVREARECQGQGHCGTFYQTDAKKSVTLAALEPDLLKAFPSASKRNIPLRFIDIVKHCEHFLDAGESLKPIPQHEAWRTLCQRANS